MATHTDHLVLGRGELYFRKRGNSGYRFFGNVPTFNVNVSSEKQDHFSSRKGIREKDRSITLQTNRTSNIVAEDVSPENLALFFLGTVLNVTQAAASNLSETFANVKRGDLLQLGVTTQNPTGIRHLVAPVVSVGGAPLTLGTDYTVDLERGFIEISPDTTAVAVAGASVEVTYGIAAGTRKQVISGSESAEGELKYVSHNAEGDVTDYYMPSVQISPNGEIALISENTMQNIPLSVEISKPGNLAAIYQDGSPLASA